MFFYLFKLDVNEHFPLNLTIKTQKCGLITANLIIQSLKDIRLYRIECISVLDGSHLSLTFTAPLSQSIIQPVPIINKTNYDWKLNAEFIGKHIWFSGPSTLQVPANTTVNYPITYVARREAINQVN